MEIQSVHSTGTLLQVTLSNGTVLWVPEDPQNADYVRIQAWVAAGGVIQTG